MALSDSDATIPVLTLDAAEWRSPEDFYRSLLRALGAPGWHGDCLPAVLDSMLGRDINAVNPPMRIVVERLGRKHHSVRSEVRAFVEAIKRVPGVSVDVQGLHQRS